MSIFSNVKLTNLKFRKMVHSLLNVTTSKKYVTYQMLENRQMLYEFLTQPQDFLKHIRRYSNALTTTMVFGWRTPTYDDEKMMQLFDGFSEFATINQTGAGLIQLPRYLHNASGKLPCDNYTRTSGRLQDSSPA